MRDGRKVTVRPALLADAEPIGRIYNYYIEATTVTFEEQAVSTAEIARRIAEITNGFPWLVAEADGAIAGYAYARPWQTRSAYRFTVESTVYLAHESTGRGIGSELYAALLADLRTRGLHCAVGGIALPNDASVALHEKLGFEKIAHFKEVGWKFGQWVDVGYWQLLL
jgi:phosphinothricin acetyltransferase